jgi:hypothetical protein
MDLHKRDSEGLGTNCYKVQADPDSDFYWDRWIRM